MNYKEFAVFEYVQLEELQMVSGGTFYHFRTHKEWREFVAPYYSTILT